MEGLQGMLYDSLFTFSAPKAIKIYDPVLGIMNRILQVVIIIYIVVIDLIINQGALYTEIPTGKSSFWGSQADLYSYQNMSWDYCNDTSQLNYADQACRNGRKSGFGIFCEFNQRCRDYSFNEINVKGEDFMSFVSYNKDITQHLGRCSDKFKEECSAMGGHHRDGETAMERYADQTAENDDIQDLESMFIYSSADGAQCYCTNMINYVARGVEGVNLNFEHTFQLSNLFPVKCSTYKNVPTYIHKESDTKDASGNSIDNPAEWSYSSCYDSNGKKMSPCKFKGETVSLSLEDLLRLAGLKDGLSSHNADGTKDRDPMEETMMLPYRTTGVEIAMDLRWYGSTDFLSGSAAGSKCENDERSISWNDEDEAPIKLYVVVSHSGGWHSFGSSVQYVEYPVASNETKDQVFTGVWHDNYKRGIKFRFMYGGSVKRFQFFVFVFKISTMIVLLGLSTTITSFVAGSLLGMKSLIYSSGMRERLHERTIRQKQAVDMFMACSILSKVHKDGMVSSTETDKCFMECGLKEIEAKTLSELIMGSDHEISVLEFCNFAGLDFMKVEELIKFEKRKYKKNRKKTENKIHVIDTATEKEGDPGS